MHKFQLMVHYLQITIFSYGRQKPKRKNYFDSVVYTILLIKNILVYTKKGR